jgi:hypothetical protein
MDGFTLRKSYLDVADGDGRCAIAYWTEVIWGPLAVRWEGLSLREPGRPVIHRGAFGGAACEAGTSPHSWRSTALGFRATCEPWCPPFATRLLETSSGTLDWSCQAPGADVAVECDDGVVVRGAGYREHLVLAMLPWKLPIDELRWGRWLLPEGRHSIVWIDWRGTRPLKLVLEDGVPRDHAAMGDDWVRCGERTLYLSAAGTLYSRTIAETLGAAAPVVQRLPAPWRALEDRKSLSRGVAGGQSGWAIHELVRFP